MNFDPADERTDQPVRHRTAGAASCCDSDSDHFLRWHFEQISITRCARRRVLELMASPATVDLNRRFGMESA